MCVSDWEGCVPFPVSYTHSTHITYIRRILQGRIPDECAHRSSGSFKQHAQFCSRSHDECERRYGDSWQGSAGWDQARVSGWRCEGCLEGGEGHLLLFQAQEGGLLGHWSCRVIKGCCSSHPLVNPSTKCKTWLCFSMQWLVSALPACVLL